MKLSFVIPALNEQDSLEILYKEIVSNCSGHSYELIFVDDGSSDGSYDILQRIAKQDAQRRPSPA